MKRRRRGAARRVAEAATKRPAKGRRFSPEQKKHAKILIDSGMERTRVAKVIGTTTESLRRWVREAGRLAQKAAEWPSGEPSLRETGRDEGRPKDSPEERRSVGHFRKRAPRARFRK